MGGGNSRDRRKFRRAVLDSIKQHKVELGVEFCVGVLIALYQLGAEQMDIPHNFWVGLGCWVVGGCIAIRICWILVDFWPIAVRIGICLIPLALFGWLIWSGAYPAYKEHYTLSPDAKRPPPAPIPPKPPIDADRRTPLRMGTVKLKVYISEVFRFKARELEFKNLDDLREASIMEINRGRPERYLIPLDHDRTVLNIIVRNTGKVAVKNARVTIMANLPIEGKTEGVHVFDLNQISYDTPLMESFEPFGAEKMYSISIPTPGGITIFVPLVEISADNLKYAAISVIKIEKSAKGY